MAVLRCHLHRERLVQDLKLNLPVAGGIPHRLSFWKEIAVPFTGRLPFPGRTHKRASRQEFQETPSHQSVPNGRGICRWTRPVPEIQSDPALLAVTLHRGDYTIRWNLSSPDSRRQNSVVIRLSHSIRQCSSVELEQECGVVLFHSRN